MPIKKGRPPKKKILNDIVPKEEEKDPYYKCCCCGKKYRKQTGNFSYSCSPMFRGNGNYLPICVNCIDNLVEQYTELLDSQDEAIKRVCLHWDYYFSESLLAASSKAELDQSRMRIYIRNCNLSQNAGGTYDNYLRELEQANEALEEEQNADSVSEDESKSNESTISDRTVKRWGLGYEDIEYQMLNDHYKMLKDKIGDDEVKDSLIKDLCEQHILKYRSRQAGDYDKYQRMSNLYQQTLSAVDLKPKNADKNVLSSNPDVSWGMFEQIIENYSPAEFIKENDKKIFKDYYAQDEYYRRFVIRPTNNLINGTNEMDSEYVIEVDEDDE